MASLNDERCHSNQEPTLESATITSSTTRSLNDIIHQCGGLGRFQWFQYCALNLINISGGLTVYYYVYGAAEPDHRCRLPSSVWPHDDQYKPTNATYESFLQSYIPKTDGKWDQCYLFDSLNINKTLECVNGWVFDRDVYGFTFTEAMNLVCRAKPKKSLLSTFMQAAGFLVLIAGMLADRFGRKRTIVTASILLFTICLVTQIAMQWIPMSINLKFGILLVNQFMAGLTHATSTIAFVMMLELTTATYRSLIGNMTFLFFAFGEILITLFAYMTRNWQNLLWANTIFIGVSVLSLYFTDESPLYLYSNKQYTGLEKLLHRMAKINGRKDANWHPAFQELLSMQLSPAINKKQPSFIEKVRQLVSQRTTIQRILITVLIIFIETLLYYKISYGLAAMKISPYMGILIGAFVEIVGYISATMLMSTRLGRKYSFIVFATLTGICIFIIPFIVKHSISATVVISQIGKFAVSAANGVSWIYMAELFPTSIRSTINGLAVAFSRLGAIAAPIIDSSVDEQYLPITFYIYAGLAFGSALLTLPLPETKNKPLDDEHDISFTSSIHMSHN